MGPELKIVQQKPHLIFWIKPHPEFAWDVLHCWEPFQTEGKETGWESRARCPWTPVSEGHRWRGRISKYTTGFQWFLPDLWLSLSGLPPLCVGPHLSLPRCLQSVHAPWLSWEKQSGNNILLIGTSARIVTLYKSSGIQDWDFSMVEFSWLWRRSLGCHFFKHIRKQAPAHLVNTCYPFLSSVL